MADDIIRLTGIHKAFAGVRALQDVSLTLERGKIHCLVGENGCGKSTLIKIIAGVYQRDSGSVQINGKEYDTCARSTRSARASRSFIRTFRSFPT
jgi:simple sugar transport system ATP-binding protein